MQTKETTHLFLTGFMGSGKTTVGKVLADLLEYPFVDLDEQIVRSENRPITTIFETDGEGYFRDCESAALTRTCQQKKFVCATGGGIVERDENRQRMKNCGQVVYLKTDWAILQSRLQESSGRPLVDSDKCWHKVKALWVKRQPLYSDADLIIETGNQNPLQVARKIALELCNESD